MLFGNSETIFRNDKKILGPQKSYLIIKRGFDFVLSLSLISFSLPIFALIFFLFLIFEPGKPLFFRQKRLGKGFREFEIIKFRTMVENAEELLKKDPELYQEYLDNNFKLPFNKDFRVTKIGRFLRKTSLDELPQLINVLKGEMSLVGPRPVVPEEIKLYQEQAGFLLSVRPGITGLWQVSGRSGIFYPDRIALDLDYLEKASLSFDLKILSKTIPAVLFGTGAH